MPGSPMSSRIAARSGSCSRCRRAASPDVAVTSVAPSGSTTARIASREVWLSSTARTSTRSCIHASRVGFPAPGLPKPLGAVLHLAGVARLEERLPVRVHPGLDLAPALELGVELRPEQHRDVRDPEPDE